MSAAPRWTIWCDYRDDNDVPRCGQWIGSEDTADQARKLAKDCGWLIRPRAKGGDLCPNHAGRPGVVGEGLYS